MIPTHVLDQVVVAFDRWCVQNNDVSVDGLVLTIYREGDGWFIPDDVATPISRLPLLVSHPDPGVLEDLLRRVSQPPGELRMWVVELDAQRCTVGVGVAFIGQIVKVYRAPGTQWLPMDMPPGARHGLRDLYEAHLMSKGCDDVVALLVQLGPTKIGFERFADRGELLRDHAMLVFRDIGKRLTKRASPGHIWVLVRPDEGDSRALLAFRVLTKRA